MGFLRASTYVHRSLYKSLYQNSFTVSLGVNIGVKCIICKHMMIQL